MWHICGIFQVVSVALSLATLSHASTTTTAQPPSTSGQQLSCPPLYDLVQGSCYRKSEPRIANTCAEFCAPYHLACISNDAENNAVFQYGYDGPGILIGYTDVALEGTFVWESCSEPNNYENWNTREPNQWSGREEDCTVIHGLHNPFGKAERTLNGKWNDVECHRLNWQCLCEAPMVPTTVSLLLNSTVLASNASDTLEAWQDLEQQLESSGPLPDDRNDLPALATATSAVLEQAAESSDPELLRNMTLTSYSIVDTFINNDRVDANLLEPAAANSIRQSLEESLVLVAKENISLTASFDNIQVVAVPVVDASEPIEVRLGHDAVLLPGSATASAATAATVIIYEDAWLFDGDELQTKVISLTLDTDTSTLNAPVVIQFELAIAEDVQLEIGDYECRYWDEEQELWLQDGCRVTALARDQLRCECTHLTNFAGMLSRNTELSSSHVAAIDVLATFVSAVCSVITAFVCFILLMCRFEKWFGLPQVRPIATKVVDQLTENHHPR